MKRGLISIALVLLVTGTSLAEMWEPTIRIVENGNSNVITYVVGIHAPASFDGITSISDTNVLGNVCQVFPWDDDVNRIIETPLENPNMTEELGNNNPFDTHLLDLSHYSESGSTTIVGEGWDEYNDGSNPAQISTQNLNGGLAGIGNMELIHYTTIAVNNPPQDLSHIEFVQTVMPFGGECIINGRFTNVTRAINRLPMVYYEIEIGTVTSASTLPGMRLLLDGQEVYNTLDVPEPSTIAMLVFGALCLVGIRFRRK